jgi:hypothetical protein
MRAFTRQLFLFTAIQGCIGAVLLQAGPVDPNSYMAATIDHNIRLDSTASPRLILVGGSSCAFGIDSKTLEQQVGLPTVNMGLHARLGRDFMLNEVQDRVRPGDVVVVSLEYELLWGDNASGTLLLELLEQRPESIAYVPWHYYPLILDEGLQYISGLVRRSVNKMMSEIITTPPPYTRDSFNAWGDVVGHSTLPATYKPPDEPLGGKLIQPDQVIAAVARLNRFQEQCRHRGAKVVYFYPQVVAQEFSQDSETLRSINECLRETLIIPILNKPDEMRYPAEWFFDTNYHLTPEGIQRRTELVSSRLIRWLKDEKHIAAPAALTATRTLSPTLMPNSSRESSVITDSMIAPPEIFTLTWHITVPRLISVTSPSSRFRAPILMVVLRSCAISSSKNQIHCIWLPSGSPSAGWMGGAHGGGSAGPFLFGRGSDNMVFIN